MSEEGGKTAPQVAPGTRLRCDSCGVEVVVVKPTVSEFTCCERSMSIA